MHRGTERSEVAQTVNVRETTFCEVQGNGCISTRTDSNTISREVSCQGPSVERF